MRLSLLPALRVAMLAWGLALSPAAALAQASEPGARGSAVGGVTVKVTPRVTAADAQTWVFAVVLDTHSQELTDDLVRTTVLVTDDGRELQPAAWQGAAPGSHHREGTLEFAAPSPVPKAFVLRMQRPGEAQPRVFSFAP